MDGGRSLASPSNAVAQALWMSRGQEEETNDTTPAYRYPVMSQHLQPATCTIRPVGLALVASDPRMSTSVASLGQVSGMGTGSSQANPSTIDVRPQTMPTPPRIPGMCAFPPVPWLVQHPYLPPFHGATNYTPGSPLTLHQWPPWAFHNVARPPWRLAQVPHHLPQQITHSDPDVVSSPQLLLHNPPNQEMLTQQVAGLNAAAQAVPVIQDNRLVATCCITPVSASNQAGYERVGDPNWTPSNFSNSDSTVTGVTEQPNTPVPTTTASTPYQAVRNWGGVSKPSDVPKAANRQRYKVLLKSKDDHAHTSPTPCPTSMEGAGLSAIVVHNASITENHSPVCRNKTILAPARIGQPQVANLENQFPVCLNTTVRAPARIGQPQVANLENQFPVCLNTTVPAPAKIGQPQVASLENQFPVCRNTTVPTPARIGQPQVVNLGTPLATSSDKPVSGAAENPGREKSDAPVTTTTVYLISNDGNSLGVSSDPNMSASLCAALRAICQQYETSSSEEESGVDQTAPGLDSNICQDGRLDSGVNSAFVQSADESLSCHTQAVVSESYVPQMLDDCQETAVELVQRDLGHVGTTQSIQPTLPLHQAVVLANSGEQFSLSAGGNEQLMQVQVPSCHREGSSVPKTASEHAECSQGGYLQENVTYVISEEDPVQCPDVARGLEHASSSGFEMKEATLPQIVQEVPLSVTESGRLQVAGNNIESDTDHVTIVIVTEAPSESGVPSSNSNSVNHSGEVNGEQRSAFQRNLEEVGSSETKGFGQSCCKTPGILASERVEAAAGLVQSSNAQSTATISKERSLDMSCSPKNAESSPVQDIGYLEDSYLSVEGTRSADGEKEASERILTMLPITDTLAEDVAANVCVFDSTLDFSPPEVNCALLPEEGSGWLDATTEA